MQSKDKESNVRRKSMMFIVAAALAASAVAAAAFAATSSASSVQSSKAAFVALGQTSLGKVLVDSRGRTLYLFENDKHGRSACYGACAAYWPPLLSTVKPRWGTGVRGSLLGLTKRSDGKRQVTYAGHPLYTFVGDKRASQTTGEGLTDFGAAWDVVSASGHGVEPTTSAAGGTGNGYGGYGGGYGG
jgi:predicted lipoprotein with Yx(FWY)xxD motif